MTNNTLRSRRRLVDPLEDAKRDGTTSDQNEHEYLLHNELPRRLRLRRQQQQRGHNIILANGTLRNAMFVVVVQIMIFIFVESGVVCRGGVTTFILSQCPQRIVHQATIRKSTHLNLTAKNTLRIADHGSPTEDELDVAESNNDNYPPLSYSNNRIVTRRTSLASAVAVGLATATFLPLLADAHATTIDDSTPQITSSSTIIINDHTNYNTRPAIQSLTIPLQYQPNLSAYTISYKVGNSQFGAIIDTGSPFLLVPESSETSCRPEYRWGCFRPEESQPAEGLEPTMERFDGNEGLVEWREGEFSFDTSVNDEQDARHTKKKDGGASSSLLLSNAASAAMIEDDSLSSNASAQSTLFPRDLMTFGVISESLMDGPGGIFLGLVKNTDKRIRPSFLGQTDVSAFSVDLREREGIAKTLTLYGGAAPDTESTEERTTSLTSSKNIDSAGIGFSNVLSAQNAIPVVRDLNKKYGDPTIHYVGIASSITANGSKLASTSRRNGKIYCIFDTGCSGMTVSPSLFDERYATARANKEKSLWGTVDVELKTVSGETVTLSAKRPITTPLGSDRPWNKRLDGHLIVLGLAFLDGNKMSVDIDGDKIWFEG